MVRGALLRILRPVIPSDRQPAEEHGPCHRDREPAERPKRELIMNLPGHNLVKRVKRIVAHAENLPVSDEAGRSDAPLHNWYSENWT